jgi:hypothetical protein
MLGTSIPVREKGNDHVSVDSWPAWNTKLADRFSSPRAKGMALVEKEMSLWFENSLLLSP